MQIFATIEEAKQAALNEFGALYVEQQIANVILISPMIAKFYGTKEGFAVDCGGEWL